MKKMLLWSIVSIGSIVLVAQGASAGTFSDSFEDGLDPGWVQYIGTWEVVEGKLLQTLEGDKWQRLMLDKLDGQDYSVNDFTITTKCGIEEGKVWVAITFLHDPVLNIAQPAGKHYTFGITSDGRNIGRIYKSSHGDRFGAAPITDWVEDAPQNVDIGKTYEYKFEVAGKTMKASVNGLPLINKTDADIYGPGKVGLFCTGVKPFWTEFSLTADSIPNSGQFAVEPREKLATAWGNVKGSSR